jgi:Protein of unknown function (DUF3626)
LRIPHQLSTFSDPSSRHLTGAPVKVDVGVETPVDVLSLAKDSQLSLPGVPPVRLAPDFGENADDIPEVSLHALKVQANQSAENHSAALPQLQARVEALGYQASDLSQALDFLDHKAPLTINIPPLAQVQGKSESILNALSKDGHYKNLWERGTRPSNPKAPKRSKADFLHKEHKTFFGTYNKATPTERPRYGALNFLNAPEGGAAVYGPGVLVLRPEVKERTTFHSRDSRFTSAENIGSVGAMAGCLLSKSDEDLRQLLEISAGRATHGSYGRDSHPGAFTGSNYIEAHIHGEIDFSKDLQAVSLHKRYQGTPTGDDAQRFADTFQVPISWYGSDAFTVNTDDFIVA